MQAGRGVPKFVVVVDNPTTQLDQRHIVVGLPVLVEGMLVDPLSLDDLHVVGVGPDGVHTHLALLTPGTGHVRH